MQKNSFEGVRESLPLMRKWVRDSLNVLVDSSRLDHSLILIAAGEVLQNCVRYGYESNGESGQISITLFSFHYGIALEIEDDAPPSDPESWISEKDASEGGLGLITVVNASSAVRYKPLSTGNLARLIFNFPEYKIDERSSAWVGDIYIARQKPHALLDHMCEGMGDYLTDWHRKLFKDAITEIRAHIESNRMKLFYHNEWHIQDVVISMVHLLKDSPQFSEGERLECLLAAAFHDHLHPGLAALGDLDEPIEVHSAFMAKVFLENWSLNEMSLAEGSVAVIEQLILSTEPRSRDHLYERSRPADDPLYHQKVLLNDADILVSLVPALGLNLARSLKYEALMTDHKSSNLYETFASRALIASECAKALISPFASH